MPIVSTTCLMVGLAIAVCSHITDTDASEKIRESANAPLNELSYIADVSEGLPHYLREWRKFRGMTQQELADALETSKSVISDMERGELQLSPKWLRRIAPILKTQPGYILDHDPADLDNDIIDIWSHIDAKDRARAANVLRQFMKTGTKS
jgi:transcriptional regulator with XRE-family HTH domain